jgi:hypothetical protein
MKPLISLVAVALVLAGCEQPGEVELTSDETDLVVTAIDLPDSSLEYQPVDSSAVLPADHQRFAGHVTVTKVRFDAGTRVDSTALSRVYFADRTRPIKRNGRTIGFFGFNLGIVTLNSIPMLQVPHRLRDTTAGFEYVQDLRASYRPNTLYQWVADPIIIDPVRVSIESPDDLTVLVPRGGSRIPRDRDLEMRWTGRGNIFIIISSRDSIAGRLRPLIALQPRTNTGRAVLPSRVLRLLPRERYFVFSFVLANRNEATVIGRFTHEVLVQAAIVHNSFVELM